MSTVIGVFNNRSQAETAVSQLRGQGISQDSVSIVGRENNLRGGTSTNNNDSGFSPADWHKGDGDVAGMTGGTTQDLSNGTTAGGAIGGLAGVLAGAGLLTIPGIGPLLALGPIVGGLAGATAGGLTGALVDLGITPKRSEHYQSELQRGGIITAVQCDPGKVDSIANVLRSNGAQDVETF